MSEHGQNSMDRTTLARWSSEILRIYDKLDQAKMDHLLNCKSIREPLNDLYDAAKNAGLSSKAFKAFIKAELAKRAYEKRLENVTPDDEDDAEAYELMRSIAEEGDLFSAAVKARDAKAPKDKPEKDAPGESGEVVDIRPRHLKQKEADRIGEENAAKIAKGIKPIGLPGADANEA